MVAVLGPGCCAGSWLLCWVLVAVLGLGCYAGLSLVSVSGGRSLAAVRERLVPAAPLVAEHRL